jgi:hypothetical protein
LNSPLPLSVDLPAQRRQHPKCHLDIWFSAERLVAKQAAADDLLRRQSVTPPVTPATIASEILVVTLALNALVELSADPVDEKPAIRKQI